MSFAGKALGKLGEDLAADYVRGLGLKIVGRNVKLNCGEIDLLCEASGNILVIAEVKTMDTDMLESPLEQVTRSKQAKLCQLASELAGRQPDKYLRIDLVGVDLTSGTPKFEYAENAVVCG